MTRHPFARDVAVGFVLTIAALSSFVQAQTPGSAPATGTNLVTIDHPGAAGANVELNFTGAMLRDLAGLGDAALAGIAQGLAPTSESEAPARRLATEQIAQIRDIVQSLDGALAELRVHVYANPGAEQSSSSQSVAEYYEKKLSGGGWERVVKASKDGQNVVVFLRWDAGSLRGVFVVAGKGSEMAIVNAVSDISPERLKSVTEKFTRVWLQMGGERELMRAFEHMQQRKGA